MKIYWRLKDVPELALLSPKQRWRIHELCLRRQFLYKRPTSRSFTAYIVFLTCSISVAILGSDVVSRFVGSHSIWCASVAMSIGIMFGWFMFNVVAVPGLRPFYQAYIESES